MASIAASRGTGRPATVMAAVALLIITAVISLVAVPSGLSDVGLIILAPALVFSVLRFVSAYWLWQGQRWAAILGFVVTLLDTLLALPGVFGAPNNRLLILAAATVVIAVPQLVLLGILMLRRVRT